MCENREVRSFSSIWIQSEFDKLWSWPTGQLMCPSGIFGWTTSHLCMHGNKVLSARLLHVTWTVARRIMNLCYTAPLFLCKHCGITQSLLVYTLQTGSAALKLIRTTSLSVTISMVRATASSNGKCNVQGTQAQLKASMLQVTMHVCAFNAWSICKLKRCSRTTRFGNYHFVDFASSWCRQRTLSFFSHALDVYCTSFALVTGSHKANVLFRAWNGVLGATHFFCGQKLPF